MCLGGRLRQGPSGPSPTSVVSSVGGPLGTYSPPPNTADLGTDKKAVVIGGGGELRGGTGGDDCVFKKLSNIYNILISETDNYKLTEACILLLWNPLDNSSIISEKSSSSPDRHSLNRSTSPILGNQQ